jgi:hypothetical protein
MNPYVKVRVCSTGVFHWELMMRLLRLGQWQISPMVLPSAAVLVVETQVVLCN